MASSSTEVLVELVVACIWISSVSDSSEGSAVPGSESLVGTIEVEGCSSGAGCDVVPFFLGFFFFFDLGSGS